MIFLSPVKKSRAINLQKITSLSCVSNEKIAITQATLVDSYKVA